LEESVGRSVAVQTNHAPSLPPLIFASYSLLWVLSSLTRSTSSRVYIRQPPDVLAGRMNPSFSQFFKVKTDTDKARAASPIIRNSLCVSIRTSKKQKSRRRHRARSADNSRYFRLIIHHHHKLAIYITLPRYS